MSLIRLSDPVFQAALLAVVFSAIVLMIRPPNSNGDTGITRMEFMWDKFHAPPVYDVVVGGDSRVMFDVNPAEMQKTHPGRILNFGFNFGGYSEAYLDALESKLNPDSPDPKIALGITPRSLTPLNMIQSEFASEARRGRFEQFQQRYLSDFFDALRPISLSGLVERIGGRVFYRNHYPDGFASLEILPPNPSQDLPTYKRIFDNNKVSQAHIDQLLERVADWTAEGIDIYGFRPPTTDAIHIAEEKSDFDQDAFVAGFEAAGGIWLPTDRDAWFYADGSHLSVEETARYSQQMGLAIQQQARPGPGDEID